jgi:hypothetical protein
VQVPWRKTSKDSGVNHKGSRRCLEQAPFLNCDTGIFVSPDNLHVFEQSLPRLFARLKDDQREKITNQTSTDPDPINLFHNDQRINL